jgi:hypothetical protein
MPSIFARIGLLVTILIVGGITMCSINKRSVLADPNVTPAFDNDKRIGQPLVDSLAAFYAAHAYYPRSLSELQLQPLDEHGFHYEVWSMSRVYKTLECAGRAKEFEGFVATIPDYRQKLEAFRLECVRGYSSFLLKSPLIDTAWRYTRSLHVWTQFSSQDAQWRVEWCTPQSRQLVDCSRNAFDEAQPAEDHARTHYHYSPARPSLTSNPR